MERGSRSAAAPDGRSREAGQGSHAVPAAARAGCPPALLHPLPLVRLRLLGHGCKRKRRIIWLACFVPQRSGNIITANSLHSSSQGYKKGSASFIGQPGLQNSGLRAYAGLSRRIAISYA